MFLRAALAASLAALALLAAGCGGGGDDTSGATSWTNDLCSAITTWTESLSTTVDTVQSQGLSKESLQNAVDEAKSSTETFVNDLKGLGRPDTQSGADAEEAVDNLAADLDQDVQDAQSAIDNASTTMGAITSVANTLKTMSNRVTTTVAQLQQLDARGEIKDAFQQADSCQSLAS